MRSHLLHIGIVEVDPNAKLRVEEEGGVVFAVVGHHADQFVFDVLRPSLVADLVEDVRETQRGPDGLEDGVDLVRGRSLRVPNDANADHLRAVEQGTTDSDFGATGVLEKDGGDIKAISCGSV